MNSELDNVLYCCNASLALWCTQACLCSNSHSVPNFSKLPKCFFTVDYCDRILCNSVASCLQEEEESFSGEQAASSEPSEPQATPAPAPRKHYRNREHFATIRTASLVREHFLRHASHLSCLQILFITGCVTERDRYSSSLCFLCLFKKTLK